MEREKLSGNLDRVEVWVVWELNTQGRLSPQTRLNLLMFVSVGVIENNSVCWWSHGDFATLISVGQGSQRSCLDV